MPHSQLSMFGLPELRQATPRKAVRKVSRAQYAALRDTPGALGKRTHVVLTALAHRYYVTQVWPTPAELTRWMYETKRIPRDAVNLVAPRVSDLINGAWMRRRQDDGSVIRVQVGGRVCEYLPERVCTVTHGLAQPIRIVEAGATLARFGYGGRN